MTIQPSDRDQAYALALSAINGLHLDPLQEALPELWARCLIRAARVGGLEQLPPIGAFFADGSTWYGYRLGPRLNVSSCGVGQWGGRLIIRVRISDFNLVMRPRTRFWRTICCAGRGEIWYFRLRPEGGIEIVEGERLVASRRGQTGELAVVSAIRDTLFLRWGFE